MRGHGRIIWVAGFIFAMSLGTGCAQRGKAGKIDAYIRPFAQAGHFSGVVLASENGRVIYEKAFGLANADFKIPNLLDTRFGIASITKYMTVVVLNRLVEEGKVGLANPVSKFIPDFPDGDKITVEMISRHRSGIPHRVMPPEAECQAYSPAEFVEKVKAAKLEFEPGAQRLYSSAGYSVLARILEIASGKPYASLLQEFVLGPAGMVDSLDFNGQTIMERRAQDYLLTPQGWINAPLKDYSFLVGAGSVFSTARDLYRFGEAVLDKKFGVRTMAVLKGPQGLSGSGSTNGHRAYLEIASDKTYGYALVSNLNCGAIDVILQGVKAILKGQEPSPAIVPQLRIIPDPDPAGYLGSYRREDGTRVEVTARSGALYAGDTRLYTVGPDRFFEYKYYGDVSFQRDAAGKITGLQWKWPGSVSEWVKI